MYDITALGEALIDFTEYGVSENGRRLFEQNPGGAPANVLAAAARFGRRTAFIGKVGGDMHGLFLKQTLSDAGIDTSGLMTAGDVFTTLAFVALGPGGERTFSFARKPGADTQLRTEEVSEEIVGKTRILHIGSLSLTDEPARGATYHAVSLAKKAGAAVSCDPNYRPTLWPDTETAKTRIRAMLANVDMIKLSGDETELATGIADPAGAALRLYGMGIPLIAVTLGHRGALVCAGGRTAAVPGYSVTAVDTTGAGDAFWGGFLHRLLLSGKAPGGVTLHDAVTFARWGNAAAALCVGKRGAIPAMPSEAEVSALMARG